MGSLAVASANNENHYYFYMSISATVFVGISVGMGEATFLGFLKGFPPHLVGYVSSGTGFAGISGTSILLILGGIGFSNTAIFLTVAPTMLIYFAAFYWLNRQKKQHVFYPNLRESEVALSKTSD